MSRFIVSGVVGFFLLLLISSDVAAARKLNLVQKNVIPHGADKAMAVSYLRSPPPLEAYPNPGSCYEPDPYGHCYPPEKPASSSTGESKTKPEN